MTRVALHHVDVRAFLRALEAVPRRGCVQERVLGALSSAAGTVPLPQLVETVHAADPDGGPLSATEGVRHAVMKLRQRGYPIRTDWTRGYFLGAR